MLEARYSPRPIHIWLEISDWAELIAWSRECDTPAQELLMQVGEKVMRESAAARFLHWVSLIPGI